MIHKLVGWDKETAIWWAGTSELTFHFDYMLCWLRSPFPPAHHGLTHAGPTLRESSGLEVPEGTAAAFPVGSCCRETLTHRSGRKKKKDAAGSPQALSFSPPRR